MRLAPAPAGVGEQILARSIDQWSEFILAALRQARTYRTLLYLLVSVVLGPCVCLLLLGGLLFSAALVVVGLGIPLLYLMVLVWWGVAIVERALAHSLLGVTIPRLPISLLAIARGRLWARLRRHLTQPIAWKALAFGLAHGPFGLGVAVLIGVGLLYSLGTAGLMLLIAALGAALLAPLWLIARLRRRAGPPGAAARQILRGAATVALLPVGLLLVVGELWGHVAQGLLSIGEQERALLETRELLKRERARADRAEEQRQALVANLSHDLRTPVANIQGHAEALLRWAQQPAAGAALPPAQLAYLAIIHRESMRLGTLFEELLTLTSTETPELRLVIDAVDAAQVVEGVYQAIAPLAYQERRITLTRTLLAGVPPVRADRQRLQQVLLNLVRNAIAHTPEGGLVALMIERRDPAHVTIAVADTGVGIAPDQQARIFERFYRSDGARGRGSGGFGLGLAIVRELVEAMGGTVSVESVINEGSCFRITLPAA